MDIYGARTKSAGEGGQPVRLADGTILSIGFSGFRDVNDLDIVVRAIAEVEKNP